MDAAVPETPLPRRRGRRAVRAIAARVQVGLPVLAQCLSGPLVRELGLGRTPPYVRAAFEDTGFAEAVGTHESVREALRLICEIQQLSYRSDYVYRSAIANKLFAARCSPATTTILTELRAGRSKADVTILNGTSVAFEIKSELDSLKRLEGQISDYSMLFDKVYVVTFRSQVDPILRLIPQRTGIIVLTQDMSLSRVREATSNADNVVPRMIVDTMRKDEVAELTRRLVGRVPTSSNVGFVDACLDVISHVRPRNVHNAMVPILKRRRSLCSAHIKSVPPELLVATLESGVPSSQWEAMMTVLTSLRISDVIGR